MKLSQEALAKEILRELQQELEALDYDVTLALETGIMRGDSVEPHTDQMRRLLTALRSLYRIRRRRKGGDPKDDTTSDSRSLAYPGAGPVPQ